MPLHLAARLHAFAHGLFRPSDEAETRELYNKVERYFDQHGLRDETGRTKLIRSLAEDILAAFGLPPDHSQFHPVAALVERIFDYEGLILLPRVDWSNRYSITEYWQIRDQLNEQWHVVEEFEKSCDLLRRSVIQCMKSRRKVQRHQRPLIMTRCQRMRRDRSLSKVSDVVASCGATSRICAWLVSAR